MNKRERFLSFVNFESVDRVPRYTNYVPACREKMKNYLGKDPMEVFDMDIGRGAPLRPPEGYTPPDYSVYFPEYINGENEFYIDENGCGHKGCGFYHFTEYISPLRNITKFEEIEKYPFVDKRNWLDDKLKDECRRAHEEGNYAFIFVGHMYECAWQVRGYEEFLMDLLSRREWAEYILDKFCNNNLITAVAAAKAGYDCIATGDDVANQNAMMFRPELWREVMKPRWAKVIAAAKQIKADIHVWYHSDGNISDILDDLVEIGIDILNPVQPECLNPTDIRKRYGKRLAFDGCIGTQTTFPFGTPESMKMTVKELADVLNAKQGGLMLAPTHVLEPEVPPENIKAFFEACDEI